MIEFITKLILVNNIIIKTFNEINGKIQRPEIKQPNIYEFLLPIIGKKRYEMIITPLFSNNVYKEASKKYTDMVMLGHSHRQPIITAIQKKSR